MRVIKNGDTSHLIHVLMVDSSDHITGKTGLTLTVTRSKNGGSFASWGGSVAEVANGWYKLTPASGDVDTQGELLIHATGTAADPADLAVLVVAYDPHAVAGLGLTNLDVASSTLATAASLATVAGYVDTEVAAIKAKTDNLPSDPADASDIAASLSTIAGYIDTEVAAILAAVDTEVAAIKAKTDNLPASPAAVGSAMTLDLTQACADDATPSNKLSFFLTVVRAMANGKITNVSGVIKLFGLDNTTQVSTSRTVSGTVPSDFSKS